MTSMRMEQRRDNPDFIICMGLQSPNHLVLELSLQKLFFLFFGGSAFAKRLPVKIPASNRSPSVEMFRAPRRRKTNQQNLDWTPGAEESKPTHANYEAAYCFTATRDDSVAFS